MVGCDGCIYFSVELKICNKDENGYCILTKSVKVSEYSIRNQQEQKGEIDG